MIELIKAGLRRVYLEDICKSLDFAIRRESWNIKREASITKRRFLRTDKTLIDEYFKTQRVKKLHIGCGKHTFKGWLNSDAYTLFDPIIYLDATKDFPFENDTFNYIYSEHMLEHITYEEGLHMLFECYRILKSHGKVRIATPDLSFLIKLYSAQKSEVQKQYIRWAIDWIMPTVDYEDTFIINNYFRDFGHKFIYDEKVLRSVLKKVGFINITKYDLSNSDDDELRNLENIQRMPVEYLTLETMILEGTKA